MYVCIGGDLCLPGWLVGLACWSASSLGGLAGLAGVVGWLGSGFDGWLGLLGWDSKSAADLKSKFLSAKPS